MSRDRIFSYFYFLAVKENNVICSFQLIWTFQLNHLYNGLAIASRNGHGIAASINKIANPKNNKERLCFAFAVIARFTETLPTWTNTQAINIINACSMVKKRVFASFMLLPRSFSRSNQELIKYNIKPRSSWISQLSIKKKLLLLSDEV